MATDRFVSLTVGQYELALERLGGAGAELEAMIEADTLPAAQRIKILRTLGEIECLRTVLESRQLSSPPPVGRSANR